MFRSSRLSECCWLWPIVLALGISPWTVQGQDTAQERKRLSSSGTSSCRLRADDSDDEFLLHPRATSPLAVGGTTWWTSSAARAVLLSVLAGSEDSGVRDTVNVKSQEKGCSLVLAGPAPIGDLRLWVPEAVVSNTGLSSAYPAGQPWRMEDGKLVQRVDEDGLFGAGNCPHVDENTLECAGIRFPVDSPVTWETTVAPRGDTVEFTIKLTNAGDRTIVKAGAAICLKFIKKDWWSDDNVFVLSGGKVRSLTELGRDAGRPNGFQAYLLQNESFDHVFYHEFWGFNRHRLDAPVMISEHRDAGLCVGITADRAYFLHSNKGNPCNDIMLAFGDVAPGATVESTGCVWIKTGTASQLLRQD